MRVLFTTFGSKSHVIAQVSLGWAARAAGHEVRVASHPDMAESITRTGLTAVPVGHPLELDAPVEYKSGDPAAAGGGESEEWAASGTADTAARFAEWTTMSDPHAEAGGYDRLHGIFTAMASQVFQTFNDAAMVDDLVSYARWWRPDLVVWDPLTFGGAVAARVSGAAHARLLFGLDLVGRMRGSYLRVLADREPALREDPMAEWLGDVLARYGGEFTEDLVVGQWTVDPLPSSLAFATGLPRVALRYVPYNGPVQIPEWLRKPPQRPRICVSFGMSLGEFPGRAQVPTADLLAALADLDVEVVAALGGADVDLAALPGNVRLVDYVPMDALLPTCAAVVNHGGSGTFNTAMSHGVPQLIIPDEIWDTVPKAEALERRGAGICMRALDGAADVRDRVGRILGDPSYRVAAHALREEVRAMPAPRETVSALGSLVAGHPRA
ncbi:activator-dependent family glycosyltransferase [Micromonospora ureilytica]|uniref:activator-dependent family glycosyltransferase n=1 Tax=Micromonospora ureilytica TaxID=709868 RepID=UPI0033C77B51